MKKLPFTIIHKNTNVDFFFDLHKETKSSKQVGEISEELINIIDKFIKKNPTTSDGDLFQALALLIATRVYISPFDNEKIFQNTFLLYRCWGWFFKLLFSFLLMGNNLGN